MILPLVEDKNPKTKSGFTPLHYAAIKGQLEIAKMILPLVEDKNPKNSYGRTPLDFAKTYGHNQVAKLLKTLFKSHNPPFLNLFPSVNCFLK